MNTINETDTNSLGRLESTIRTFVERFNVLGVERDEAVNNIARLSDELKDTREQLELVQAADAGIEISLGDSDSSDNEAGKQAVLEKIDLLIERIDALHIDD